MAMHHDIMASRPQTQKSFENNEEIRENHVKTISKIEIRCL